MLIDIDEGEDSLIAALRAYLPDPEMGRFLRRHPLLMVAWASLGALSFYIFVVSIIARIG